MAKIFNEGGSCYYTNPILRNNIATITGIAIKGTKKSLKTME